VPLNFSTPKKTIGWPMASKGYEYMKGVWGGASMASRVCVHLFTRSFLCVWSR